MITAKKTQITKTDEILTKGSRPASAQDAITIRIISRIAIPEQVSNVYLSSVSFFRTPVPASRTGNPTRMPARKAHAEQKSKISYAG